MNEILRIGQTIRTESGGACRVERFLGGGGQGEVYEANWEGKRFALKWYYPHTATASQMDRLRLLVSKGSPSEKFLWPVEICSSQDGIAGYGYLMRVRDPQYKGILDLMKRRTEPTFRALATAGIQLADCYLQLHGRGLCYCDISWGNVFWEPQTGDVLICDNDNVIVNGEQPEIAGTIGFMAPEVVTGRSAPNRETDKFSLAVLLFRMFMLHHPLEGKKETSIKCFDQPAKVKLYGAEPVFIFDPDDDSNRPDPRYHSIVNNFWPIYPQSFRDLMTKAFTKGLRDPQNRVTETEWKQAMVRLRDAIMYCGNCSAENFYDPDTLKAAGGKSPACWSCAKEITLPFRIRIGKSVVMLNHDSKLYPHHVDDNEYDFSSAVAEVARHPKDPKIWGLKNLSKDKWVMISADGAVKDVEPGRSASLVSGARINFGRIEGEVRY